MKKNFYILLRNWLPALLVGGTCVVGMVVAERSMYNKEKAQQKKKIEQAFGDPKAIVENVHPANYTDFIKPLYPVPDELLKRKHLFKRSLIKGRIYKKLVKDFPQHIDREWALAKMRKNCLRAESLAVNNQERARVFYLHARHNMLKEDWRQAMRWINKTQALETKSRHRQDLEFYKIKCLRKIDDNNEDVLSHLNKLLDNNLEKSRRVRLLLEKADILCQRVVDASYLQNGEAVQNKTPEITASAQKAQKSYKKVIELLSITEPEKRFRCIFGLIRLFAAQQKEDAVYNWLEQLDEQRYAQEKLDKIYTLISRMELAMGRPERAIHTLKMVLQQSEDKSRHVPQLWVLFEIQKVQQAYDQALQTLSMLATYTSDKKQSRRILASLLPDEKGENAFLEALAVQEEPQRDRNLEKLLSLLQNLQMTVDPRHEGLRQQASFLEGYANWVFQRYAQADASLQEYLSRMEGKDRNRDNAAFWRVLIAQKHRDLPTAVLALRARFYLNLFPSGLHSRKVRRLLQDVYDSMQLYKGAAEVAKTVLLNNMVTAAEQALGGDQKQEQRQRWIDSMGKSAVAFMKDEQFAEAEQLFDMFMYAAGPESASDKVLLYWTRAAIQQGQTKEAMRRAAVALYNMEDETMKRKVEMAQYLRQLQIAEEPETKLQTLNKLENVIKTYAFTDNERKTRVYDAMQQTLFELEKRERAAAMLKRLARDDALPRAFYEKWYLQWLGRFLGTDNPAGEIANNLKGMLPEAYADAEEGETYVDYGLFLGDQLAKLDALSNAEELKTALQKDGGEQ